MVEEKDIASVYNLYVDDLFNYAVYLGFDRSAAMDAIYDVFCKLVVDHTRAKTIDNIRF